MISRSIGRKPSGKAASDPMGDATSEQTVTCRPLQSLKAYPRNARLHSRKQVRQIADSIERFGFTNPVLIDDDGMILAGHGRVEAAKLLGHEHVPCLRLSSMTESDKRAYVLADNKLALNAGWDEDILGSELQLLLDGGEIDLSLTGFTIAEIDGLLDPGGVDEATEAEEDDRLPPIPDDLVAVTQAGDLWRLGPHQLICGDARDEAVYRRLMRRDHIDGSGREGGGAPEGVETIRGVDPSAPPGGSVHDPFEQAQMVFTDPPYNVPVNGHVMGSGRIRHREFAMASGEMDRDAFTEFLSTVFARLVQHTVDGSIHFICMDWRHMDEILSAGRAHYTELKNLIAWVKDNGGMGTFYRSRHELIFAFKNGMAPHISFELGQHGRYRTNVWNYRGMSSPSRASRQELALHPTVKPVAMLADAMRDCSDRGGLVLDAFCGSGSVLIAAHKTGRRARAIEIDPVYCDTAIRRWQAFAKCDAVLMTTGETFDEVATRRAEEAISVKLPVNTGEPETNGTGATDAAGIRRGGGDSRAAVRTVPVQGQSPWAKEAEPERGGLRR